MSASTAVSDASQVARERRRADPAWQQIRAERAIAAPYMNRVEPRIVFEAVWSLAGWALFGLLGIAGWVPYWIAVPMSGIFAYAAYMPLHEATHQTIHGGKAELQWLNDAAGHLMSIPLLFSFRGHELEHMAHHAHTNDPEKDPDVAYSGSLSKTLFFSLTALPVIFVVFLAAWFSPLARLLRETLEKSLGANADADIAYQRRFCTIVLIVASLAAYAGYGVEVLVFWFLPAMIGLVLIGIFFAWLPHHPHNGRGRYTNTRATLFPLSGLIARGHDRHIIHHMIPRVPHYRIPQVFDKLRPVLEARGTRIEGPSAGPGAPKIFRGTDAAEVEAIGRRSDQADAEPISPAFLAQL